MVIGVLALQGGFAKHREVLEKMGVSALEIRRPEELQKCQALVIPGGESTTISRQIHLIGLSEPLKEFGRIKPIFGTCAGLILLAQEWRFLDIEVERNGYGPQFESFSTEVFVELGQEKKNHQGKPTENTGKGSTVPFHAIFIRAPRIRQVGKGVEVLSTLNGEPILVRQGHILGATFHPELFSDFSIHKYFLQMLR